MLQNTPISALVLAAVIISAPAQASVNQTAFDHNIAKVNSNITALDIGHALTSNAARSTKPPPVVVAWSIKSVAKKAAKGVKKVAKKVKGTAKRVGKGAKVVGSTYKTGIIGTGRLAGQAILKANKLMPSEIRNGASWAYRKGKKAAKHVIKHPYGKRCKPNKFLQPVCKVGPTKRRVNVQAKRRVNVHDHRSGNVRAKPRVNVHDHRSGNVQAKPRVNVHDHRSGNVQVSRR